VIAPAGLSGLHDKRERRTRARLEQLDGQIVDVLQQDHPQSVRHVFYRMTDPRLREPVEKSERGYRHVQERLKQLRLAGAVPYGWITDATRRGYHVDTFSPAANFLSRMAGLYRADLWTSSPCYVEVWCESRSIAGVIERDCEELAVSLYPAGGFSSMTLVYEAAEYIKAEITETGKRPIIIYIGDYDPAGVLIDIDIKTKLERHLDIAFDFRRIAINEEQVRLYDLPTKPRKETDRRAAHITYSVEAEAMPAEMLRDLLRQEVEDLLPPDALRVARVAEESEQDYLLAVAEAMGKAAR
jgi:hypothetical protein